MKRLLTLALFGLLLGGLAYGSYVPPAGVTGSVQYKQDAQNMGGSAYLKYITASNKLSIGKATIEATTGNISSEGTISANGGKLTGTLLVDTINEYTSANGVNVEGVNLKDSNVWVPTGHYVGLAAGLSLNFNGAGSEIDVQGGGLNLNANDISDVGNIHSSNIYTDAIESNTTHFHSLTVTGEGTVAGSFNAGALTSETTVVADGGNSNLWNTAYSSTNNATPLNTANRIVKRDASGGFNAQIVTAESALITNTVVAPTIVASTTFFTPILNVTNAGDVANNLQVGSLTSEASVKAVKFYGDGSSLTGITGGSLFADHRWTGLNTFEAITTLKQVNGNATFEAATIGILSGAMNAASQAVTNINIDSGTIDGVNIGGDTQGTGAFTSLTCSTSFRAVGAEPFKIWTYSHSITAGEATAHAADVTISSLTRSKVRGAVVTILGDSASTVFGPTFTSAGRLITYQITSATNISVAFGTSYATNDVIQIIIFEAL